MDKQTAYDIVDGIGGICASQKEYDEALCKIIDVDVEWYKFVMNLDWYKFDGEVLHPAYKRI